MSSVKLMIRKITSNKKLLNYLSTRRLFSGILVGQSIMQQRRTTESTTFINNGQHTHCQSHWM